MCAVCHVWCVYMGDEGKSKLKAIACGVQCNWRMKCSENNKPTKKILVVWTSKNQAEHCAGILCIDIRGRIINISTPEDLLQANTTLGDTL